jgi:hypothetical protein
MRIHNHTPFVADTLLWEDPEGALSLSVLVKCTFTVAWRDASRRPEPAAKQLPLFDADLPHEGDGLTSVKFESDRVPFKPVADVVVVGKAQSPGGQPVPFLDVAVRVGGAAKALRVFGDRTWRFPTRLALAARISAPEPFTTMDLVYERAFGGIDSVGGHCPDNPIGKGYNSRKSPAAVHGKPLPNLEDPDRLIRSPGDRPLPASFGFYGRGWMPRLAYAGTYDEAYHITRAPKPPADFSQRFFNGAHPDLQVTGYLRGDEEVELVNVGAEGARQFRLPGFRPRVSVFEYAVPPGRWLEEQAAAGKQVGLDDAPVRPTQLRMELDTLVLVPDEKLFYEVFRGVYPLHKGEEAIARVARVEVA